MGSTEQTQQSSQHQQSRPWAMTMPALHNLIGQLQGQLGQTGLTGTESQAFNQLTKNAQAGNPFAGQMSNLANSLFSGGNGKLDDAYADYEKRMSPYADGKMLGPDGNPMLNKYLDTNRADISSQVNGMFAAAGRDFSGANLNSLSRGITEGNAPILASQYNTDVGRQFDAANGLYSNANNTENMKAQFGQAGVGVSDAAMRAQNYGPNQLLAIEAQKRGIPMQNLSSIAQLLTPLAQLGGTQHGTSTGSSTTTPPLGMQLVQGASSLMSAAKKAPPGLPGSGV